MRLVLPVLLVGSCTAPADRPTPSKASLPNKIAAKPPSSFEDSLLVGSPIAVFFRPDSVQLEKIKAVNSAIVFANLTHDGYFEMRYAKQVIQRYWPKIKIAETCTHRWLLFRRATGAVRLIDLNADNDICGVFLFDGTKDPIRVDMPNIDTQLWYYFGSRWR